MSCPDNNEKKIKQIKLTYKRTITDKDKLNVNYG